MAAQLRDSAAAKGPVPAAGGAPASLSEPLQNRAGASKSPFVRRAQGSLVKWQLLDAASVQRAKRDNKLVFLHVGYRACHCRCSNGASPPVGR